MKDDLILHHLNSPPPHSPTKLSMIIIGNDFWWEANTRSIDVSMGHKFRVMTWWDVVFERFFPNFFALL